MDINWRQFFSPTILERGKKYYQKGHVFAMRGNNESDTKSFYVQGTNHYMVTITRDDNSIKSMRCTCPYCKEGNFCKHMAAALFMMEEDGDLMIRTPRYGSHSSKGRKNKTTEKKAGPVRIFPFKKNSASKAGEIMYQYYDLDKATSPYTIYDQTLRSALILIEEKIVVISSLHEEYQHDYYGEIFRQCVVSGQYKESGGKTYSIKVGFTKDKIIDMTCEVAECPQRSTGHYYYYDSLRRQNICSHTLAILLMAWELIKKEHIGDATDYNGALLLQKCRAKRAETRLLAASAEKSTSQIRLEPRLDIEQDGSMNLVFRVGLEKLYVVKNLTELVHIVENHREMKLGKNHSISFGTDGFDEESQALYRFIKSEVKIAMMRSAELFKKYDYDFGELKAYISLYGRTLDEFFNLMEDKSFPFTCKTTGEKTSGEALCLVKSPQIKLHIKRYIEDNSFEGIILSGKLPNFVIGNDYKYFFDGKNLCRINDNSHELLESIRRSSYTDDISIIIGRRNLSEFYHRMLPMLDEFAEVEIDDAEEIKKYLHPEAEFAFYLDVEDDMLSCKAQVTYGKETCSLMATDQPSAEYHDRALEIEVMETLSEFFPEKNADGVLYCNNEDQQYRVLECGVDTLLKLGEVHATDRFSRLTIRRKPQITVGVRMESDLLKLSLSSTDLTEDELLDVLNKYQRLKKYHRLKNGDFVQVDENTMEELQTLMNLTKSTPKDFVKGDMTAPAYRALYLDKVLKRNEEFYAKRDRKFKQLVKEFKTVSDSEYDVPESLQGIMRNYQEFGYKWLRTVEAYKFGGILADDMGLGKTLQIISVLLAAKEEQRLESAIVVTPASLVYNWKEEFAKFAPQLSVSVIAGNKTEREELLQGTDHADVLITSYDLLKRDIHLYEKKCFTYQIIDEAQSIKTHTTAAAKAVKAVNSKLRFALTGTPIENRLSELWSIFDFLMPGFLYSYERFRKEFELPIMKKQDQNAMTRLKRFVEPFIMRRLKQDVLSDLPEKIEEICYVQFEQKQQHLYDGQVVRMKKILESQSEESYRKSKIAILAEITKIRQICCDPALCFDNYDGESAKREACLDLLRSAVDGGHKILVFSQFRSLLELLEKDLQKEGFPYFKITGETKKEERIDMVKRFNVDNTPVFLISLKAGGTGLNLTGADIVIHLDPWWNIAAQNQATDRAHRIGQTKSVSVYKLIAKNTMEEKILKMQETKQALAEEILSGNTGGLMNMSRDELLELL